MKEAYYLLIILLLQPVCADITFFEGKDLNFIIKEEVQDITTYCGDYVCNNDETCSSCESDCGTCGGSSGMFFPKINPEDDYNLNNSKTPVDQEAKEISFVDDTLLGINAKICYFIGGALLLVALILFYLLRRKKKCLEFK